ncbi:SDR family oxidoreductase [Rhodococcus olei]|uniref:SDR family oxidoreductase n=1 Tax=Rhodococcus olei TaxID=2161675 RepID=A0ABP8NVE7_9NOCA
MSSRTYVVTGASSGMGAATAQRLRADGGRVITADIKDADVVADLATAEGRETFGREVERLADGVVDGVVAAAGLAIDAPVTAAVNYFGMVATAESLRPLLSRSEAPRAVVVSSIAATSPFDQELVDLLLTGAESRALERCRDVAGGSTRGGGNHIYSSSKHAIARWVRRQAPTPEWAGAGIALNAVGPGVIETAMTAPLLQDPGKRALLTSSSPAPLNGPAAPPEVPAALLSWLVSEENSYVTGQVIYIDGGGEAIRRPDHV